MKTQMRIKTNLEQTRDFTTPGYPRSLRHETVTIYYLRNPTRDYKLTAGGGLLLVRKTRAAWYPFAQESHLIEPSILNMPIRILVPK